MKGITIVQAFQFWLKLTAIAVPALFLLVYFHHPAFSSLRGEAPPTFATATTVKFPDAEQVDLKFPVTVGAYGVVDGVHRHGPLLLAAGATSVGAGSSLRFPAGANAPTLASTVLLNASEWESPLVRINGIADHPLGRSGCLTFSYAFTPTPMALPPARQRPSCSCSWLVFTSSRPSSRLLEGSMHPSYTRPVRRTRLFWRYPAS